MRTKSENKDLRQCGGVSITGSKVTVGGSIVGGDLAVGTHSSILHLESAFEPVAESIRSTPGVNETAAMQKLEEITKEAAKGENARDIVVAKLIEGLVGLVPGAVSAIVSAFATPLVGGIAGPATKYVLDKIQHK
jgi:hypothetical protein